MSTAVLPPPPRWLPARLVIAGLIVTGILSAAGGGSFWGSWGQLNDPTFIARGIRSMIILLTALGLAASTGFTITWAASLGGSVLSTITAFAGRALALFPAAALAWGLVGWWIGVLGLPVETLMPAHFDTNVNGTDMALGVMVWEYLAPTIVLALPLLGEIVAGAAAPSRAGLQAVWLLAPAWLMLVEDVLHFPGLGGWVAQEIRAGQTTRVAAGLGGLACISAAGCFLMHLIPGGGTEGTGHLRGLGWLPWPLWVLGLCSLGVSERGIWLMMWLALAGMSLPGCASSLRALDRMGQVRWVAAWSVETFSGLVLWLAAVAAVHPRPLSGGIMREFRPFIIDTQARAAETLAQPALILSAGAVFLAVALGLHLIACLLRPGASSRLEMHAAGEGK